VKFVFRMAWRETRASWGRLLFFFVCVAMGVAAIVVLRSVVQTVRITLTREARQLIGADVVLQAQRDWTAELATRRDRVLADPSVRAHTEVVETQTMAQPADGKGSGGVRLVELRGVEAAFPFYGVPELEGGRPYSHALLADHGVLVQPDLLREFGLGVGDRITLAGQPFTIRGVVTRDRVQRASGMALGPRVYMDLADLRSLPLLGFGSRATYQVLVRVDAAWVGTLTEFARSVFQGQTVTVRSWRVVEDRLGRNLQTAENYLSLVGFAMVVLGGIGVWSVTRVVVQQKIRSVAILKCVGATSGRVLATYVLQVTWLAAGGCLLGVLLAAVAVAAIPQRVLAPLGVTSAGVTVSAAAQGIAVGLLVALLFALVPLLEVRRVKPLLLLRADSVGTAGRRDWQSVFATVAVLAALALVAIWQADSLRAGLYVSGGLAAVGLALLGVSRLLVAAVRPFARSPYFALRHAIISLRRPNNQTRVILLSVGLGCFFILAVRAVQGNLLEEFSLQVGPHAPDLVLIDIQRDQLDGLRAAVGPYVRQPPRLLPILRARVVGVDGRRVQLPTLEDVRRHGELTREYGITYREALQDNETIVDGAFWLGPLGADQTPDGLDTEVSIEQSEAARAHVGVGDLMRFDLAGHVLRARVTSVRQVTWDEVQNGGFMFVFRPAPALARAPQTYVGFLELAEDPGARLAVQRALMTVAPNVSAIDVRDVLASFRDVINNATLGVTIVGAVTLAGGVLILIGAVAMTKFQRLYDAAIYRTLGAGTRLLMSMVAIEYGLLGLLAGALGAGGALAMSWALARGLFDIAWRPAPGLLVAGVLLTAAAVGAVGLAASAEILVRKPLATLRGE
jgi:putative ABC transport system permease protein